MQLEYLVFDTSDEENGSCSFDAMASALPARLAALIDEVEAVLGWAYRKFGPPSVEGDGTGWDFEMQAVGEQDAPLEITCNVELAQVSMPPGSVGRVTLALTISGSRAFAAALKEEFEWD